MAGRSSGLGESGSGAAHKGAAKRRHTPSLVADGDQVNDCCNWLGQQSRHGAPSCTMPRFSGTHMDQVYESRVVTFGLRRMNPPIRPKPSNIMLQVAGSGSAAVLGVNVPPIAN